MGALKHHKISNPHTIVKVCNETDAVFTISNVKIFLHMKRSHSFIRELSIQYTDAHKVPSFKLRPWDSKRFQNQESDNQYDENTLQIKNKT